MRRGWLTIPSIPALFFLTLCVSRFLTSQVCRSVVQVAQVLRDLTSHDLDSSHICLYAYTALIADAA